MRVLDPDGLLGGRKIYTSSVRTSLLPIFDGLRYRHLVVDCSLYGLQAGERGNDPKFLCDIGSKGLCIECSLSG
jgi:hypothetical protein